jgi:ribosomal protein S27AE
MANFVKHEPCPNCGSKDNLARYDDGSAWCFGGCGYREKANRIPVSNAAWLEREENGLQLDEDLGFDYPRHVVEWLGKYGIAPEEGIKHGWKYGAKRDQLVFIFRDEAGVPQVTQARNFWSGAKSKYYNQGSPESLLPIFRIGDSTRHVPRSLVVVEDAVSAAKVARQCDAMPCLGSHLSNSKLARVRALGYQQMVLWLDHDKWKEATIMSDRAKLLGFTTKVVYTEKDPKEHTDEQIANYVGLPVVAD